MNVQNTVAWVRTNTKVITAMLIIMALLIGGNAWMNHRIAVTTQRAVVAEQALQQQKVANAELQKNFDQKSATYKADKSALETKNATLQNEVAQREVTLNTFQAKVANESTADLAKELTAETNAQPGQIIALQNGAQVDTDVLRELVTNVGTLHVREADVVSLQTINANLTKELADADAVVGACTAQVSGLKQEISKQSTACKAEIAEVKAKDRKSKRNWFLRGIVVGGGVVAYLVIHYR